MVTLTAALSQDTGNGVSFGTDGGLFATAPPAPQGGTAGHTFDLSAAASGQAWWYNLPGANTQTTISGSAIYWPLLVTRAARLTGAALNVGTAGTGSHLRNALYAADPVTGLPGTAISSNWFIVNTAAVAFTTATGVDTTSVLSAFTPYYVLTWVYTTSGYPVVSCRTGAGSMIAPLPRVALPTSTSSYNTGYFGYTETVSAAAWNTLTVPPATVGTSGSPAAYAPYYWLQFTNV